MLWGGQTSHEDRPLAQAPSAPYLTTTPLSKEVQLHGRRWRLKAFRSVHRCAVNDRIDLHCLQPLDRWRWTFMVSNMPLAEVTAYR